MSKRLATLITTVLMLAVFTVSQAQGIVAGSVSTGTSITIAPAPVPVNQIIMRDGGVCDPIRHMGC